MRKIEENLEVKWTHVPVAAAQQEEVTLPTLGDRVAFIMKSLSWGYTTGGGTPAIVGAGIVFNQWAYSGDDQSAAANILALDNIIVAMMQQFTASAAGNLPLQPDQTTANLIPKIRPILFRQLFLYSYYQNVTPLGQVSMNLTVDAYQLTTSEFVDLLG